LKRIIPFILSCTLIFVLAACGQEPIVEEQELEPIIVEPSPEPDFDVIFEEDEMTGDEEDHPWIEDEPHEFSYTHDEAIVAALTPDDAYIHSDVESMLVLMSHMPMNEFIAFCLNAVDELGATEVTIDESRNGFWVFDGLLDDDIHLHIELRDDGDSVNMMVLY